ncbi:MAG: hypothetical protein ABIC04_03565 [Nanoarchaeota archaeon]
MPKIQQTKNDQFIINIPKHIIRLKNWKKHTELIFIPDGEGAISIKELKPGKGAV